MPKSLTRKKPGLVKPVSTKSKTPAKVDVAVVKTSKKQKIKQRKVTFLEKLQAAQSKKASSWTPHSGPSLHELLSALPEYNEQLEKNSQQEQSGNGHITIQQRNQILMKGRTDFGLVLGHPQFQANPLGTIREHLTNVITKSEEERQEKTIQRI